MALVFSRNLIHCILASLVWIGCSINATDTNSTGCNSSNASHAANASNASDECGNLTGNSSEEVSSVVPLEDDNITNVTNETTTTTPLPEDEEIKVVQISTFSTELTLGDPTKYTDAAFLTAMASAMSVAVSDLKVKSATFSVHIKYGITAYDAAKLKSVLADMTGLSASKITITNSRRLTSSRRLVATAVSVEIAAADGTEAANVATKTANETQIGNALVDAGVAGADVVVEEAPVAKIVVVVEARGQPGGPALAAPASADLVPHLPKDAFGDKPVVTVSKAVVTTVEVKVKKQVTVSSATTLVASCVTMLLAFVGIADRS